MGKVLADGHTVRKTTVELDLTELEVAKVTLGTRTTRETVNAALREVNRRAALARAAARIERGDLDLITPEELAALRRPRM